MKRLINTILNNQHRPNETIHIYLDPAGNIFTTWNDMSYMDNKLYILSFTYVAESLPYSRDEIVDYVLDAENS